MSSSLCNILRGDAPQLTGKAMIIHFYIRADDIVFVGFAS